MSIGNRPPSVRADGRGPSDLRPVTLTLGVLKWAEGSCRIRVGDTEVLCAATITDRVPPHLRGKGTGWVTAEYAMLPRATSERTDRESVKGRLGGRTHEIQRLVGRSLRGVVDLARLGERTVTVDCDVLQADGGTRCASITGGYVALAAALMTYGMERLIVGKVAAVSVGVVEGIALLDLDYGEDSQAEVDLQRRRHGRGHVRRAPGHGRGKPFDRPRVDALLDLRTSAGPALRDQGTPSRPSALVVPDPGRRHGGPVRGHDRRPRPAPSPRQGHGLGDGRVRDAAAGHRGANGARERPRAASAAGRTRSSASSGARCAASWTWPGSASGRSRSTATCSRPTAGRARASITGGYVALAAALMTYGMERLIVGKVAAVSVGVIDGHRRCSTSTTRGLAGRGRLQRRRHGRGHVRRAPGHGRGQALRPAEGGRAARSRERRPGPALRDPGHALATVRR